jgi:ArsR family transcriptional regulator
VKTYTPLAITYECAYTITHPGPRTSNGSSILTRPSVGGPWLTANRIDGSFISLFNEMTKHMSRSDLISVFKALASSARLKVLELLKDPRGNFPPQVDGDLVKDGVCADYIREKLQVSASTASQHLKILADAGLIRPKRIKQWTFFRRCEPRIRQIKEEIGLQLSKG